MSKILSNPHTHSNLCDGKNALSEMAEAAWRLGFVSLGFSGHGYAPYDTCSMSEAGMAAYRDEVRRLARAYEGRMRIWLGVEQDAFSPVERPLYDYILGSVHDLYSPESGAYVPVDWKPEALDALVAWRYHGDGLSMARAYYREVAEMAERDRPDILGHFDLIVKLNGDGRYFDTESRAYRRVALEALERAAATGCAFEINTGGMHRGYTKRPYPDRFLLERLRELGARMIISSDSHSVDTLDYAFDECEQLLRSVGFSQVLRLGTGEALFETVAL